MNINEQTILFIANTITGDNQISFRRTGNELVSFFNSIGFCDKYGEGFPTRRIYVEEKIRSINGTPQLKNTFEKLLDPRNYIDTLCDLNEIISKINEYLKYDKYKIEIINNFPKVVDLKTKLVEVESIFDESNNINHIFINEQLSKCDKKISDEDYDGAITNSRSLIEAVLLEIQHQITQNTIKYDGDLNKLYKNVSKLLNLEPNRKDISDSLKQVLTGIISIVAGLAGLRNKMSDSHVRTYKPEKHHAKFSVNLAKTIIDFITESFEYQKSKGFIKIDVTADIL